MVFPARPDWKDSSYYNEDYYQDYDGQGPYTADIWLPFFRHIANSIVADSFPKTTIEFGCAKGFLVQALRAIGVDSWGIDWSTYAIGSIDPIVAPYCSVGDIRQKLDLQFDVAICMEVLEHLEEVDASCAISTLVLSANTVYFSSNPNEDFPSESHINVRPSEYWERLFEREGMLKDATKQPKYIAPWAVKFTRKPVDIILPVYNSPLQLQRCVSSLYSTADRDSFHVILVDDGSNQYTQNVIDKIVAEHTNISLIRHETNEGYLSAANHGLRMSRADYVILLNSDVILTPDWLNKLLAAAKSDPKIGLVCPLSNRAENLSIPMPNGFSFLDTVAVISQVTPQYPDAVTIVGFCLLITRPLIDAIGYFDPLFSPGYVEEADYQFRAMDIGFRAVVADNSYIYHARSASFGSGTPHFQDNYPLFLERWGPAYHEALTAFEESGALQNVKEALQKVAVVPPDFTYDIVYYLPSAMAGIGGMISVVEVANRMVLQGFRVAVAHPGEWLIDVDCLFSPISYPTEAAFVAAPPRTRVLVATGYQTVLPVTQICRAYGIAGAYFIQDYEGYFDGARPLPYVSTTYDKISTRIVVSQWLADLLQSQHSVDSSIIPLGVATDEFYPRSDNTPPVIGELHLQGKTVVFAVLRDEERRGSPFLIDLAQRALTANPALHFIFAGAMKITNQRNITAVGLLGRQQLAAYLSASDIAIDSSLFHGFGMLAIEAMACGTAVVLTDSGGCHEYANPEVNCLLTPPRDVKAMEEAVNRLTIDGSLRRRLGEEGRSTAIHFDWTKLAAKQSAILLSLGSSVNLRDFPQVHLPKVTFSSDPLQESGEISEPDHLRETGLITVYQTFNGISHLYSVNPTEVRNSSYHFEGPAFTIWSEKFEGAVPLYRFRNRKIGIYCLNANDSEMTDRNYICEGALGYILPNQSQRTIPLHSAFHPKNGDYIYSTTELAGVNAGYIPVGTLGYVLADAMPSIEERLGWLENSLNRSTRQVRNPLYKRAQRLIRTARRS